MDPLARFAEIVHGPEPELPLDEAAMLIAAHAEPALDVAAELASLDALAAGCRTPTLDGLRAHLFGDLGFTGNGDDYYDPRNSYLHTVVARRTGIPITLSVLTMEVGRRIGVPLDGVGMPGHFLVRDKVDTGVFVDPFARGQVLDRRGCEQRFRATQGPGAAFDESYLQPVGRRAIVARMLANLEAIFLSRQDVEGLVWLLRLKAALPGARPAESRKLVSLLMSAGRYGDATAELDRLAAVLPGEGGDRLRRHADLLRAKLN